MGTVFIDSAQKTISIHKNQDNSLVVESSVVNRNKSGGAGKRYYLNYSIEKGEAEYRIITHAIKSSTYQGNTFGILSFAVPKFDDDDLLRYMLGASFIEYRFEVNSEFNSESVYANFARTLEKRNLKDGTKDPVTGKIFKQEFILPYRGRGVAFALDTFPYRNGSKVVMYMKIPSFVTSANTVDFRIIMNEIKSKLTDIVKS